jgi:hypothetical protein
MRRPPVNTGNVKISITAVKKIAQGNNGIVLHVRLQDLRFHTVIKKFKLVRHEDIPDMSNPTTTKAVLEGDKLIKEVLKGGYNVHPVPPPNSVHKESITKRYETGRMRIDKLLTLGYTTSADPRKIGTK